MKKILVLLFVLLISLTGCGKQESGNANATWDCVEYESLDEINGVIGSNIVTAPIDNVGDEWFAVIGGNIAEYKFKVNDEEWSVRASKDCDNDISGIYSDSIKFEKDVTGTYYTDDYYLFRFFNNDIQYVISLIVTDKDITGRYFDDIVNEFKTNITGVKSGYDIELLEDGDVVTYKATMYNDDGTTIIMETVYTFENDKMVSIVSSTIFETEELAKAYLDELAAGGMSTDGITLDGTKLVSNSSSNLEFYSDYTKQEFIDQMKSSLNM